MDERKRERMEEKEKESGMEERSGGRDRQHRGVKASTVAVTACGRECKGGVKRG